MVVVDYTLPPNWVAIDLKAPIGAQVDGVMRRMFYNARDEMTQARRSVGARLRQGVEAAKGKGAVELLLEVDPVMGIRTGSSLTIVPFPSSVEDPMDAVMAVASSVPGAEVLEAADLVVLKTDVAKDETSAFVENVRGFANLVPGLDDKDLSVLNVSRRSLTYYVGHPDRKDDWFVVFGQILLDGREEAAEFGDAIVRLSDAIVCSMRLL